MEQSKVRTYSSVPLLLTVVDPLPPAVRTKPVKQAGSPRNSPRTATKVLGRSAARVCAMSRQKRKVVCRNCRSRSNIFSVSSCRDYALSWGQRLGSSSDTTLQAKKKEAGCPARVGRPWAVRCDVRDSTVLLSFSRPQVQHLWSYTLGRLFSAGKLIM